MSLRRQKIRDTFKPDLKDFGIDPNSWKDTTVNRSSNDTQTGFF